MNTVSRYYELRLYRMLPTRMPDFHDLLGVQVPPLFRKCGVSRPLGFWESYVGPYASLFGYILPWESLDARMEAWTRFYADPVWQEKLSANYAGTQRVDQPSVLILRPSSQWSRFHGQEPAREVGGVHEMRFYDVAPVGNDEELGERIAFAQNCGATILGLFDAWIGLPLNRRVVFLAWPDEAVRLSTRIAEREAFPDDTPETQVMRPIDYGVPFSDLSPTVSAKEVS